MAYLKDHSLILTKKNIKEKSSIIYILTKNFGIKKLIAKGINRPEAKLLSVVQPGYLGKIFWVEEENYAKLVSFLPYKLPYKVFRLYPYTYLWALKTLLIFKFPMVSEDFWNLIVNLDKFILSFRKNFPLWFLLKIFQELGVEPNIENCYKCGKILESDVYRYKSYLFCEKCRKDSYQKIPVKDYLEIKNFFKGKVNYLKKKNSFEVVKNILKEHLKEIEI